MLAGSQTIMRIWICLIQLIKMRCLRERSVRRLSQMPIDCIGRPLRACRRLTLILGFQSISIRPMCQWIPYWKMPKNQKPKFRMLLEDMQRMEQEQVGETIRVGAQSVYQTATSFLTVNKVQWLKVMARIIGYHSLDRRDHHQKLKMFTVPVHFKNKVKREEKWSILLK